MAVSHHSLEKGLVVNILLVALGCSVVEDGFNIRDDTEFF